MAFYCEQFKTLRSAGEMLVSVYGLTERFPPEEKYVMVPLLRDTALSVFEDISFGLAGIHPNHRMQFLLRTRRHLEELHARFALCHSLGLLNDGTYSEFMNRYSLFRSELSELLKDLRDHNSEPPAR
ncbi:MAG: four helix bundle protein [bacterium]